MPKKVSTDRLTQIDSFFIVFGIILVIALAIGEVHMMNSGNDATPSICVGITDKVMVVSVNNSSPDNPGYESEGMDGGNDYLGRMLIILPPGDDFPITIFPKMVISGVRVAVNEEGWDFSSLIHMKQAYPMLELVVSARYDEQKKMFVHETFLCRRFDVAGGSWSNRAGAQFSCLPKH